MIPWRTAVAVVVVLPAFVLVAGCGDSASPDGSDGVPRTGGSAASGRPASVAEFCAPYVEMRQALDALDYSGDADTIAAELAPIMRTWAEQLPGLQRPPGIEDDVWVGLRLLAKRILRLPARPTRRQLDAVEGNLTEDERRLITDAGNWFEANCDLSDTGSASQR